MLAACRKGGRRRSPAWTPISNPIHDKENAMQVQPCLFFDGRTEEAIGFYQKTLGAKVEMLMRFKENPDKGYNPPDSDEKVMHACFRVGDTQVMASDGGCTGKTANLFQGFSRSVDAKTKGRIG
jgi:PhnB protein